jgi:hypothetical protein
LAEPKKVVIFVETIKNDNIMKNTTNHEKFLKIVDLIEELSKSSSFESGERQFFAQRIMIQSLIWGSTNHYEGLGILECTKDEWKEIQEEFEAEEE